MPASVTFSMGSCTSSSSRLFVYINSRALGLKSVTGKKVPPVLKCQQQRRLAHSWISGHPHSILYKPSKAGSKTNIVGSPNSTAGSGVNGASGCSNGGNTSSTSSSSSFLDFAGNSRYQAYNLARFSTLSAASSSSSTSTRTQDPAASIQTQSQSIPGATGSNADKAHSNPADAESQSPSSPSLSTTGSSTREHHDDKEDDWAVNESYSGHGGNFTPSSSLSSTTESTHDSNSTPSNQHTSSSMIYDDGDSNYESQTALRPSLLSFKNPAAIEASWRRTSDSLPSVVSPSAATALSQTPPSKAGGLDLSSSTLVQQMLFKERAPHSDNTEGEGRNRSQSDEGNSTTTNSQHANDNFADWDDEDHFTERKQNETQITTSPTPESPVSSPSLTSMMLDQFNSEKSSSGDLVALSPTKHDKKSSNKVRQEEEEEDHISKLDIRIGVVRSVAVHPDAESLYIEQVDVGDKEGDQLKETRTIVSGLVRHVPKDYLEGRAVVVVSNMKPSKLRGVVSQGMLLCAMEQDSNGEVVKVGLLEPAEGSQPGDKVTFEGYTDEATVPVAVLTPKRKWFEKTQVHFSVKDGVAYYKGSPFRTVQGLVRCKSISEGQIS
ncbi:Aminoacyl tRNA synthase complex-interacting multifunctional protein 1 [Mortierella sp. AD094]|nr:Aminoacyl tRNA synthase complex-interacting multifunctional protein 1 [Mortierella sp. AD094]